MCEGSPEEVAAWLRQLEEDAGIAPSWEVLVQVMCCPVPQALKAALDGALTALARRPDLAAALWERLLAAVVVQPLAMGGAGLETAGLSRYDLAYQLNEIEARAEDYSEAVAFVRLLNALWRCGGGVLAEDGRAVGHFTRFVREEVLGTAFQRTYRRPSQCWELVEAALEHCQLCLEALTLPPAALAAEAASPLAAARPPGLDVLLDLLGERAAMRAALATLSCGVDALAHERYASPFGSAKEGAALAALRLLRSGFAADESFVAAAQRSLQRASYETLDAVLRHDRARIPLLLEYVRYPHNPALQVEALRLAEVLARRGPNMVPFLLNAPSDGPVPIAHRLQDGFAACLHDAMATGGSAGGQEAEDEGERPDPRASLVLDLLLACLESPTPNFTQLLCGYDVDSGMAPLALLDPRALHTPLRVALEALADPRLATRRPQLYEHCLELVYELAAGPDTGEIRGDQDPPQTILACTTPIFRHPMSYCRPCHPGPAAWLPRHPGAPARHCGLCTAAPSRALARRLPPPTRLAAAPAGPGAAPGRHSAGHPLRQCDLPAGRPVWGGGRRARPRAHSRPGRPVAGGSGRTRRAAAGAWRLSRGAAHAGRAGGGAPAGLPCRPREGRAARGGVSRRRPAGR